MSTQLFPSLTGLTWPVVRDEIWSTTIQENYSGKEVRQNRWSYPRWKWTLMFNMLRQGAFNGTTYTEFAQLSGFFNSRGGRFDSFLYRDTKDNAVTNQAIATGDGSTTIFQMVRTWGGFTEPMFAIDTMTSLTVNGVPKTEGVDYGVNRWNNSGVQPGLLVFLTGAPGAGQAIVATFNFWFPVRFSDDTLSFNQFMDPLFEGKKVAFQSIK